MSIPSASSLKSLLNPLFGLLDDYGIAVAWMHSDDGMDGSTDHTYVGARPPVELQAKRSVMAPRKAQAARWAYWHSEMLAKNGYVTTPVEAPEGICPGLKGGIAHLGNSIGVSGLSAQADELLAAVLLYYIEHNPMGYEGAMYLHHVGERLPTLEAFEAATYEGTRRDMGDYVQSFVESTWPSARYYEAQYYPNWLSRYSAHMDFGFPTSTHATAFMGWLWHITGIEPKIFNDADPKRDPISTLWVPLNDKGDVLGVAARYNEYNPVVGR